MEHTVTISVSPDTFLYTYNFYKKHFDNQTKCDIVTYDRVVATSVLLTNFIYGDGYISLSYKE